MTVIFRKVKKYEYSILFQVIIATAEESSLWFDCETCWFSTSTSTYLPV